MSRTEPLNDVDERAVAAAEADLERLLSIQPSPEFAAKVRARIAAEPPAGSWNWRLLLPLAAAVVLILVVTVATSRNAPDGERPFATAQHDDIVLPAAKVNQAPDDVRVTTVARNRPTVHPPIASPQAEPEIIIDPAITDAIRRLALAARNTTLDGSKGESIAAPDSGSETLPIAGELNVPEIVLKPADQTGGQ